MRQDIITLPDITERSHSHKATAQVFNDPESKKLLEYIKQIAPSEASVLIHGETGTGKELIARQIHEHSHRRHKPFIAVNCGAFSENLVESELFGHEKGAFTGALSSSAGWFEAANGGTLLLDEIGDLSKRIQVKLLRVLQEREVVRLGSRKSIPVNVRVLAATNVNLEQAIIGDQFREDLYYRLNVVTLNIKPLRERKGDILPLAYHFIDKYHAQLGYDKAEFADAAKKKLSSYWWPGNIRELENMIHHALLICQNNLIESDDLTLLKSPSQLNQSKLNEDKPAQPVIDPKLKEVFHSLFQQHEGKVYAQFEDQLLRIAYHYCHQNQVKTAQLLGLSRNVVRSRLIELGELVVSRRGTE
ncbi:sigma-54 dependent transcriptional regulator [Acinetobacter sp. VNH17]|uniref:Sigma-54 dependent transcriptional regulator n=1 Tax=Acinetobacter thutiue TaxID=2998078 RepID=A0ABT7WLZ4_9GAMM|nr:sigma-54 dependent transcriptional regulator [Acinetobacter thutiue]MCY6411599.1 sigma-54 dependent transcriptional regulator [Acinetobacter thutiue]MDN0013701.1 sigma-54 dependent transcriptional regulator [Acinetobacter thutiue]